MFDFAPDETTRLLLDTVRRFVRTELVPLEEEVERDGALAPERAAELVDSIGNGVFQAGFESLKQRFGG